MTVDRRRPRDQVVLSFGETVTTAAMIDADPAGAIHEALRRSRPSVACLASHGRGRAAAITGSVATDVVARGHDPVVLVGPLSASPVLVVPRLAP